MKYVIYTTSRPQWFIEQAKIAAGFLMQSKGRNNVSYDVKRIKPPSPLMYTDKKGDRRIAWDWFTEHMPCGDYDGVIFHFTSTYRRRWRISSKIGGSRNKDNREYLQAWICDDKQIAKNYDFSSFVRKLLHEHGHFDEDIDNNLGNRLPQGTVHLMDYKLHAIHLLPKLVDYRGYLLKRRVDKAFRFVVKLFVYEIRNADLIQTARNQ